MKAQLLSICLLLIFGSLFAQQDDLYFISKGNISFVSYAPLELIEASSSKLSGVIKKSERTFAFSINMNSFEGFNSPLQKEHFKEKYMEVATYPKATFSGKIIEKIDFSRPGEYEVRAKGKLDIHGISQERIIKGTLTIEKNRIRIISSFRVPLQDHNISIPELVYQKIAEEIVVGISAELEAKE